MSVGANDYGLSYEYSLSGQLKREVYPSGRAVSYGFDVSARPASVSGAGDTRESVALPFESGVNVFTFILNAAFRRPGDETSPEEALKSLDASDGIHLEGTAINTKQDVFDGRRSTLPITDPGGNQTTVSKFFAAHPTVNAITNGGTIFLGQGFFNQDRNGRALSMVHEGVVHKGFGRADREFDRAADPLWVEGSHAINRIIDRYYPHR